MLNTTLIRRNSHTSKGPSNRYNFFSREREQQLNRWIKNEQGDQLKEEKVKERKRGNNEIPRDRTLMQRKKKTLRNPIMSRRGKHFISSSGMRRSTLMRFIESV